MLIQIYLAIRDDRLTRAIGVLLLPDEARKGSINGPRSRNLIAVILATILDQLAYAKHSVSSTIVALFCVQIL